MNSAVPSALIIGIEHFAAKKLAIELLKKDIVVVGVGEYVSDLSGENLEIKMSLEELGEAAFSYVFDFKGETDYWHKIGSAKLTIVCVNDPAKAADLTRHVRELELNWRLVNGLGVFGYGMEDEWFLTDALRLAASNKNLVLPSLSFRYRLLSVADLVEAILRASFLSGTEKEVFLVAGNEFNSEELARVLIDEAKMTRFKVVQNEMQIDKTDEGEVQLSRKKLRWQPKEELRDSIRETLQYFFCRLDEESRRKNKSQPTERKKTTVSAEEKVRKERLEVVVEAEEPSEEVVELADIPVLEEKKAEAAETDQTERASSPEIDWNDFKPLIKNSNIRPMGVEETEEEIVEDEEEESLVTSPVTVSELKTSIRPNLGIKIKIRPLPGKWQWYLTGLLIICLFTPANWIRINYLTVRNIYGVEKLIKEKKYTQAEKLADLYWKQNKAIDQKIDDLGLNKIEFFRNYQVMIKVAEDTIVLEKKSIALAESADKIGEAIFNNKNVDWDRELANISDGLADVDQNIGLLQARLGGNWSWLPARYRTQPQKANKELENIKKTIELAQKGVTILPSLVGTGNKKKEYLLIFQNEMELRPTGGFIGSFGLLGFENGHLLNLDVKDVYEADGQLNGHVEPPEEIKNILGEAGWFMRDANWKASFPATASDLQWFLEKETGRKVDGVIGVDLAVAKALIGVVGEVYVPDFKEKINKDNLYEQAEYYSEKNFFPGSNQKASFLGSLSKQLFEEIKNSKTDQKISLVKSLIELLEENEIRLALNDKNAAQVLADLNWDGSLYQGRCALENCTADYLYLVEANLGVNKANYFLYRNLEEQVDISSNSLSRLVKITYENTAKNTTWPGGDYKNYLRVYLPSDVNLAQVSLADTDNPGSPKIYSNDELKIRQEGNKKEIGFLVSVPVNEKRVVEIRYSSNIDLSQKNKFSYLNYVQRQPGFGDTGLVTLISFPGDWQPQQVQPAASLVGGKLLFNQKFDRDIKMGVELGK